MSSISFQHGIDSSVRVLRAGIAGTMFAGLAATLGLQSVLAADGPAMRVRIQTIAGDKFDSRLLSMSRDAAVLADDQRGRRRIALDDIDMIIPVGLGTAASDAESTGLDRRCAFHLADGGRLFGRLVASSGAQAAASNRLETPDAVEPSRTGGTRKLTVDAGFKTPVAIPIGALAGVRFGPRRAAAVEAQFRQKLSARPPGRDVLIVERSAEAVVLPGALERLDPGGWTFQFGNRIRSGSLDQAYAVVLGAAPLADAAHTTRVVCHGDMQFNGSIVSADAGHLVVDAGPLGRIEVPWRMVARIEVQSGRVHFLSDLDPTDTVMRSTLGAEWPPKRNTNVTGRPIVIGRQPYENGIGVHAYTALVYDLAGGYERFMADIGVDDAMNGRGSVVFRILGDGRVLFESETLEGGRPPESVSVDVTGVRILTLECDDAGDLGLSDHGDWADARLIRFKTAASG